jgi:NAD-dependent deacetylase
MTATTATTTGRCNDADEGGPRRWAQRQCGGNEAAMNPGTKEQVDRLREIIGSARAIVFFGGAGVSTESGIPDFRSKDGINKAQARYGRPPEYLVSRSAFDNETELFFKYYKENFIHPDALPNPAHKALAALERQGRLAAVITQNVDGLHQAAGSRAVIELHGSIHRNHCVSCGKAYSLDYVMAPANCIGPGNLQTLTPRCAACAATVKPDVVLYEEPLDHAALDAAQKALRAADCLIVGGTSLVVYPAAGLIRLFSGDNLVFINKGTTDFDEAADLVIRDNIGEVLGSL